MNIHDVTNHLLEAEESNSYLFQYSIKVIRDPDRVGVDEIKEKMDWIKENYRKIIEICYYEGRDIFGDRVLVSKDEFLDIIEPISLEIFATEPEMTTILTFKLGGALEGKLMTVEITDDDQIGFVGLKTP